MYSPKIVRMNVLGTHKLKSYSLSLFGNKLEEVLGCFDCYSDALADGSGVM